MSSVSAPGSKRLVAGRLQVYALAALALQVVVLLIWMIRFYLVEDRAAPMVGYDFSVFWSAARGALERNAASVFSAQWVGPIEAAVRHQDGYSPWPYPPTFLLVVVLLGLLPFTGALLLYLGCGLCAYAVMLARIRRKIDRALLPLLAAFPGIPVAVGMGQSTLLTVSAAGAALILLESRSAVAGIFIAMLAIKPQFGVLFPVALVCGRQWKALVVAALCTLAFTAASVAVFGVEAWRAFAAYLPEFNRIAVEQGGSGMWPGMPTVFAMSRALGCPVGVAYAVHGLVAAPAVIVVAFLWAVRARFELRAAALVCATLLVQPYLMFYDLAWLILPITLLLRDARKQALSRAEWTVLAAAWLAPLQGVLAAYVGWYLQVVPLVLFAMLGMVVRRHLRSPGIRRSAAGAATDVAIGPCS